MAHATPPTPAIVTTVPKHLWSRARCQHCGAPMLLTERCPYCAEALDLLGEFADWVDAGGADQ